MDLQSIFYILAIAVMVSWLIFVVAVIFFLWKINQSINHFKKETVDRVENAIRENKAKIAGAVSATAVTYIADRIRGFFNRD